MRLSEFFPKKQILRDGDFAALGLSNTTGVAGLLSFLDSARYAEELKANPNIGAVICRAEDVSTLPERIVGIVVADNPRWTYFELHNRLCSLASYTPQLKPSVIPASCSISPLAHIDPMGVELGEHVVVEEFVSIHGPCRIGDHTVLHAGVKLGGEGFEIKYRDHQVMDAIHVGNLKIGSHVVLWENVTVHKAVYPWDTTSIGDRSRIGAQSHIDHGAKIGEAVKVYAGCVVSGRTTVHDHAFIGPGSVVTNRIEIGAGATIRIGSVVTKDVPAGTTVSGNFAVEHAAHLAYVKTMQHSLENR